MTNISERNIDDQWSDEVLINISNQWQQWWNGNNKSM